MRTTINTTGCVNAGREGATVVNAPRDQRLGDADAVGVLCGWSARTVMRYADAGIMPWGIKCGALRRWDLDEIESWISQGCPRVRPVKGGAR